MKLRATAPTAQLDYSSGDVVLSFRIPKESRCNVDDVLNLKGDLTLEVTKYRKSRSLDANAYLWVLCDKIARQIRSSKEEIYRNIIRKVGVFDCVTVRAKAAESIVSAWESRGTGWIADTISEDENCSIIALYYGSSCYNTEEFSRLLDETISDAKELGIETATPDEIALMKARWADERQKNESTRNTA